MVRLSSVRGIWLLLFLFLIKSASMSDGNKTYCEHNSIFIFFTLSFRCIRPIQQGQCKIGCLEMKRSGRERHLKRQHWIRLLNFLSDFLEQKVGRLDGIVGIGQNFTDGCILALI